MRHLICLSVLALACGAAGAQQVALIGVIGGKAAVIAVDGGDPKTVKVGIPQDKGKQIQKLIKDSKIKVAASIQGDAVRVSGAKKDDLQSAIQLVRTSVTDVPIQFINFRD